MTGTLRVRTKIVMTVAKIPSVNASNLALLRPGMLEWSVAILQSFPRMLKG